MLRILIFSALTMAIGVAVAEESDFVAADSRIEDVQRDTQSAMNEVDAVDVSKTLPSFEEAAQRSESLPQVRFPDLDAELTDPKTLSSIADLMDDAQALAARLGVPQASEAGVSVYVFASFSMPDASLKSLIRQGELAGVPIVLRGLVDNSIEATMRAVHSLYEEDEKPESGALIDPTLFQRFAIDQVPTVVVAERAATACTPTDCPIPEHVKIAGDVPLGYALDRIALAQPQFRHELRALMRKLEPERQW
jgi:conjugal transfer pilus assembly protein TrbC